MQITLFASPSISFRQMRDGPTLPPSIPGFDAYHVQTKSMEGDQSKVVFVLPILRGVWLLRIIVWGNYSFSFTHNSNPSPASSRLLKLYTQSSIMNIWDSFSCDYPSPWPLPTVLWMMPSLRVQTTSLIRWLAELRISVKEVLYACFRSILHTRAELLLTTFNHCLDSSLTGY